MFSKIIKFIRKENNETQQMMAEKLGVSQRTVASWESGDRMPAYETLFQISDIYKVTTDFLLGRENHPDFYRHVVEMPSGKTFVVLSNEKNPPTEEEKEKLYKSLQNTLHAGVTKVFPGLDPDQLEAFDAYIRQVVRAELNAHDKDL